MLRANPVDNQTTKKILQKIPNDRARPRMWTTASRSASLDRAGRARRIQRAPTNCRNPRVTVHRFEEIIGGRAYHIEVTPVSNRWRAQLCRMPGVPTAMMPFYGQTPDEAARLLANWLTLAHRRQSAAPVSELQNRATG